MPIGSPEALLSIDSDGNYRLTDNIGLNSVWQVPSGITITLDLNGSSIRQTASTNVIIVASNANLTITDMSHGEPGKITGGRGVTYGGGVYVSGNFTLAGGNITGNTATSGGGVYVYNDGRFTLAGGKITNNTATSGGGVYVESSNFTQLGGDIINNSVINYGQGGGVYVEDGDFTLMNGNVTGNTAIHGGGVYVDQNSIFTQKNGNVNGNIVNNMGGGIRVLGTFIQDGGNVAGNKAESDGGGVNVASGGKFIQEGGNVTGNHATSGGGVYVDQSSIITQKNGNVTDNRANYVGGIYVRGTFIQEGGNVTGNTAKSSDGGVYFDGNEYLISGGSVIDNYADDVLSNLCLPSLKTVNIVGTLAGEGMIGVTTRIKPKMGESIIFTNETDVANVQFFFSDNRNYHVSMVDEKLALKYEKGTDKLPTESGSHYLKNDVEIADTWEIPANQNIVLDLCGFSITMNKSHRVIDVKPTANLTIIDTIGGGKITGGKGVNYGGGVYVSGNFTLAGGNLTGNTADLYGGGVYVTDGGIFVQYGGNITGNRAESDGGGVYVTNRGSFTLDGGNVVGNTAITTGGGIQATNGGIITQVSGNVTGNHATYGGGVYLHGTGSCFKQTGGNIINNSASENGGGVYVYTGSSFTQLLGNITGNKAPSGNGGGVYVDGESSKFTQEGGTITDNRAINGGGMFVIHGGNFTQSGGKITVNNANNGGGVSVWDKGTFTQSGGNVTDNHATSGGGVHVSGSSSHFTQTSGNVMNNTASNGGGVYVNNNGQFTQSGGNVTGNNATSGGGVHIADSRSNFTQTSGNVAGNTASSNGGGVYVAGGNFTLAGGNTTCNNAKLGGGVYVTGISSFTQSGGNVTGNHASNYGDGVYVDMGTKNTFNVSGNAKVDANNEVYLKTGKTINLTGNSFTGSVLNITGESFGVGRTVVKIIGDAKAPDIIDRFVLQEKTRTLVYDEMSNALIVHSAHPSGECCNATDADGRKVPTDSWTVWSNTTALPSEAGNYVLDENVNLTSAWYISSGKINLCLNGHVINQTAKTRVIWVDFGAQLVIYDCSNEIKHYFDKNSEGVWVLNDMNKSSIYNVTGGVITGGYRSGEGSDGSGVYVTNGGRFTLVSGNIVGNTAMGSGGGVCVIGSNFIMHGGNIIGNKAYGTGSGVYVGKHQGIGNFTMSQDAIVDATNEVYLSSGNVITITGLDFIGHAMNITGASLTSGRTVVEIADDSDVRAENIINQFKLKDSSMTLVVGDDGKTLIASGSHPPKIASAALSLSNDIAVRFIVLNSSLVGYHDTNLSVAFNGTKYTLKPVGDPVNDWVVFTFKNISPAMMNETMTATLYATPDAGENALAFDTREYSVKKYCTNMLEKYNAKNTLTTLCVDLLNYGSAAQVYTGEADSTKLVNYTLSAEQAGWASAPVAPRDDFDRTEGDDLVGKWRAAALNLYSDISVIFKFTLVNEVDTSKLKAVVTYGQYGDKTTNITKFKDAKYGESDEACKSFTFSNMNALELNYPIKVKLIYEDGVEKESDTIQYSVDTYCHSKSSDGGVLGELVDSIMKYTRSVAAYAGADVPE